MLHVRTVFLRKLVESQFAVVLNWFGIINAFKNLVKASIMYQQTHNSFIIFGSFETEAQRDPG